MYRTMDYTRCEAIEDFNAIGILYTFNVGLEIYY